jgi:hypothetical protein
MATLFSECVFRCCLPVPGPASHGPTSRRPDARPRLRGAGGQNLLALFRVIELPDPPVELLPVELREVGILHAGGRCSPRPGRPICPISSPIPARRIFRTAPSSWRQVHSEFAALSSGRAVMTPKNKSLRRGWRAYAGFRLGTAPEPTPLASHDIFSAHSGGARSYSEPRTSASPLAGLCLIAPLSPAYELLQARLLANFECKHCRASPRPSRS